MLPTRPYDKKTSDLEFFPLRFGKFGPFFPWKYLCIGWSHTFHPEIWKIFAKIKNTDWRLLYSFFFPLPKNCQKGNYFKILAKIPCFFHKRVAKFHPNCLVLREVTIVLSRPVYWAIGHVQKCLHLSQNWGYLALWLHYKIEKANLYTIP